MCDQCEVSGRMLSAGRSHFWTVPSLRPEILGSLLDVGTHPVSVRPDVRLGLKVSSVDFPGLWSREETSPLCSGRTYPPRFLI